MVLCNEFGDLVGQRYLNGDAIALDLLFLDRLDGLFCFRTVTLPNAVVNSYLEMADVSIDPIRLNIDSSNSRLYECPLFFMKCSRLFILI